MLSKRAWGRHYQNVDPTAMLLSASERSSSPESSCGTGNEEGEGPTAQDLEFPYCNDQYDGESEHEVTSRTGQFL